MKPSILYMYTHTPGLARYASVGPGNCCWCQSLVAATGSIGPLGSRMFESVHARYIQTCRSSLEG